MKIDCVPSETDNPNSRGEDREMTFCKTTSNLDPAWTVLDPPVGSHLQAYMPLSPPSGQLPEYRVVSVQWESGHVTIYNPLFQTSASPPPPNHTYQAGKTCELIGPDEGDTREWWGHRRIGGRVVATPHLQRTIPTLPMIAIKNIGSVFPDPYFSTRPGKSREVFI